MDNDQQREIIMIGFADCRRARADEISGLAVGRKDFNLSMTAVLHVSKECNLWNSDTYKRHRESRSPDKRLSLVHRKNRCKHLQMQLRQRRICGDPYSLAL